jgi:hypothetical protein
VRGAVKAGETPEIVDNRRYFDDDGRIAMDLLSPPVVRELRYCRGIADLFERGLSGASV